MRRLALLALALVLVLVPPAPAQEEEPEEEEEEGLPSLVTAGLEALAAEGPEAAVRRWLRGSPLEGGPEPARHVAALRDARTAYGPYLGHALVAVRNASPATRAVYVELHFARAPLYGRFLVYAPAGKRMVVGLAFSPDARELLPPSLEF
jgi:hypothetical protein